jgi:hypothetical protein
MALIAVTTATSMSRFIMLTVFTLFLAMLITPSVAPIPSQVPCTYTCPATDLAGRPLITQVDNPGQILCRFETVPNDFFCKYFTSNGLLKQDHDDNECPPTAVPGSGCTMRKRTGVPRAAAPPMPAARDAKPELMQTRGNLGKSRRGQILPRT